jgi:hypothetical protein
MASTSGSTTSVMAKVDGKDLDNKIFSVSSLPTLKDLSWRTTSLPKGQHTLELLYHPNDYDHELASGRIRIIEIPNEK